MSQWKKLTHEAADDEDGSMTLKKRTGLHHAFNQDQAGEGADKGPDPNQDTTRFGLWGSSMSQKP